jgi:hypothetical protein
MADHLCARCGSKVIPLPQREVRLGPGSELIGLVVGGAVYRVLMSIIIAALTALGFVYWVAWVVAALLLLALSYFAYTKWKASHCRFFCNACGIDLPSDMVRKT